MSTIITITVSELTKIIIKEMIYLHDLSNSFIINKDFIFTLNFWLDLCHQLKI